MSEENVAIIRRAYELLNRRDADSLGELCANDFVIDMTERVFNPDIYRGPEGIGVSSATWMRLGRVTAGIWRKRDRRGTR